MGACHEGIEEVKEDGTIVLTDEAYKIQKRLYGINQREYLFADMENIAGELLIAGKKLIERYG